MSMFADIAVQHELENLLFIIEQRRKEGLSEEEILRSIELDMKAIIEEFKGGWR